MRKSQVPSQVYQIKLTLLRIKPPVWRRLLVSADTTLADMHDIIQLAMGWADAHLHQFEAEGIRYSPSRSHGMRLTLDGALEEKNHTISAVAPAKGAKIHYEYDFGDSWEHLILVEKILPYDAAQELPVCIKGARACPPEDSGGSFSYPYLIEALQDPAHSDHEMYMEWIGEFDPEAFDIEMVNAKLRGLK